MHALPTMPTVVLPTSRILRFLTAASPAAMGATALLTGPAFLDTREELVKLRRYTEVAELVLNTGENRRCLFTDRLSALQNAKDWRRDGTIEDLLLQFLDHADAPQSRTVHETEEGVELLGGATSEVHSDSGSADSSAMDSGLQFCMTTRAGSAIASPRFTRRSIELPKRRIHFGHWM